MTVCAIKSFENRAREIRMRMKMLWDLFISFIMSDITIVEEKENEFAIVMDIQAKCSLFGLVCST